MTQDPNMTPWPESRETLRVARISDRCTVLGPGERAVVWVQGCVFRCRECVVPEMLPFAGGDEVAISELAERFVELPSIEGVTFSGGEPMSQAAALSALIDGITARRKLSFLSYTGHRLDQLLRHGTAAQRGLLDRLDILIDGLYLPERHTDLRWRGSENQQVHFLTAHYRHLEPLIHERGRWMEFELQADNTVAWMGIPPRGFRSALPDRLKRLGIDLVEGESR